jgi:hypothetical protein
MLLSPADCWGQRVVSPFVTPTCSCALCAPFCLSVCAGTAADLNMMLWSALGTNTTASLEAILEQYAGYFMPGPAPQALAQLLLGLETNWVGSLAANPSVPATLTAALDLAQGYPDLLLSNWRLQVGMVCACLHPHLFPIHPPPTPPSSPLSPTRVRMQSYVFRAIFDAVVQGRLVLAQSGGRLCPALLWGGGAVGD